MSALFDELRSNRLCWLPDLGLGFYPVTANPYNDDYFANYASLADTEIGRKLNAARLAMLDRHWTGGEVVDVGIGAGTFCQARPGIKGYDVNPVGVAWLKERGLYLDPYQRKVSIACFWDSWEHILDPVPLLANVQDVVLVSIPIFRDHAHARASKHFKPAEHAWYFTHGGFVVLMGCLGWDCVEENNEETKIGREDIRSYAFKRTPAWGDL